MKRAFFCMMFVLVPVLTYADQFSLEVYATRFDSIPVGVVNFRSTNEHTIRSDFPWDIIANNFDLSGRFEITQTAVFDSALFAERGIALYIDGQYTIEGNNILLECYLRDVATRTPLISRRYRGESRFLRNMVHRYSNELVETLFGDRGFFESRIVYVRTSGSRKNIAVMDFDGHNRIMLTNNDIINIFPTFADKTTVLWTSYLRGKPDIYRGSITDGTSRIFLQGPAMLVTPDVSPIDGTIAFGSSQAGTLNIHTCAPNGTRQRQLTFTRSIDTAPSWSPNGYQIAFTSDRGGRPQIYIMDATGSNQRRITFGNRHDDTPSWSPRGDMIAYTSGGGQQFDIWIVPLDGSDAVMVANLPGMNEYPTWSPDGRLIAFVNTIGGRSDLYMVKPDGTRLRKITNSGDVRMPRWSGF